MKKIILMAVILSSFSAMAALNKSQKTPKIITYKTILQLIDYRKMMIA